MGTVDPNSQAGMMPTMMRPTMMRQACALFVALLSLFATGCGGNPPSMGPEHEIEGGGESVMSTAGWLEFTDLSLHTNIEATDPLEPYVRGRILGGMFYPTGAIVGPKVEPSGRRARFLLRGWLDLRTRAFYLENSEREKTTPYVDGAKDRESGGFHPTADIVNDAGAEG